MISIVLVDDHKILRQNIRTLLEFEIDFEILGEAGDGHEALTLIENKLPDIVVTDLSMPGCNGFELTNEIQNRGWPTRVIVLSMHANQNYVSAAFKRGAKAYVLKESGRANSESDQRSP